MFRNYQLRSYLQAWGVNNEMLRDFISKYPPVFPLPQHYTIENNSFIIFTKVKEYNEHIQLFWKPYEKVFLYAYLQSTNLVIAK